MVFVGSKPSSCINHGDTAWVLLSTILVCGMIPALGFFEAGLLRSKNALSVLTQVMAGSAILLFMWFLFGFSLVYGEDQYGLIGNFKYAFFLDLGNDCFDGAPTIPSLAFAIFQGMFAAITPLLLTGTFAERMPFKPFVILTVAWELIVYYPLAHWVWGKGGWLKEYGVVDFAGGIVIHTSAGAAAIVIALSTYRFLYLLPVAIMLSLNFLSRPPFLSVRVFVCSCVRLCTSMT